LPWVASEGSDALFRVSSGPIDPASTRFLPKNGMKLKFAVIRLLRASRTPDPEVEPLDPHFIVEP
jgi:hypothetical protein